LIKVDRIDEIKKIERIMNYMLIRKHLLLEIISTKSIKSSMELDFIYSKIIELNDRIYKFIKWIKEFYIENI